ncbi:PREDICTED: ATP-binding cassette sub-family G member 2-like isoform X2 [Chinchilla lanigera]|uniref:ATP-binding cassette sub-family G member 2-like isoform X2 n=1 Tax=Chinchilla lanigera TaxID=34839 RepID=UPI0006991298|nr:PREDICTED: ATP-binding cassette sub-family G member 2-like isoform X2 [Chinchilla lanigera]
MSSSDSQISISMSEEQCMTSSDLNTCTEGPVLSFHNIYYQVKVKHGFLPCWKTDVKEILSNVSGIMRPGLNAIMGPTAGGKSVLLDVLAGRKDPRGLSGDVLIDGEPPPADFKCNSGYVVKDDVVLITLTVREHLQFSAALRLPRMSNEEKNKRIENIIEKLGLKNVADSKVLSKGERKRTSVAVELITDPRILFLDEPTTGLDPSTAHAVVSHLKEMSRQGRTIIFSVHQPQYSIFKLFDSLTLLSAGKVVFHGPAQKAVEYFASAGYHCEPSNNPADFFLDVICGDSSVILNREGQDCSDSSVVGYRQEEATFLVENRKEKGSEGRRQEEASSVAENREEEDSDAEETGELNRRNKSLVGSLAELYANSSQYREINGELDQLSKGGRPRSSASEVTYTTSFWHQLGWIMKRSFKNCVGYPRVTIIQLLSIIGAGVIVSSIFLGLNNNCTGIQNRASVLFTLTVFQCFSSVSAGEIFMLEKKLFIHEYTSGYYGLSSYFFGKLFAELIPRRFLPTVIFTFILYFLFGLKAGAEAFFIMMLTVILVTYTASSMALAIEIEPRLEYVTTFSMNLYFVFMMIFLSMSLYFETIAPVFSWFQYLSIPHFGFTALQHNEFLGLNFCLGLNTTEHSDCPNYIMHGPSVPGGFNSLWTFGVNKLTLRASKACGLDAQAENS